MIHLHRDGLEVDLCRPGEYYQGTRFDRAGVFRRIVKDGYVFADEWFTHKDPLRHDRVCGPSEEFVTVSFDGVAPDGLFCKPGVGLLRRPDEAPYDWFRLYQIGHPGTWDVQVQDTEATYGHTLPGWYRYRKRIVLQDGSNLLIEHTLEWMAPQPLKGFFYNHNFFTFNGKTVGPTRSFRFPFPPDGNWRTRYDNVRFSEDGVQFTGPVPADKAVYCGNLHNAGGATPCRFSVAEGSRSVEVSGDFDLDHHVLWANDRVACLEPYLPLRLQPFETVRWTLRYTLR